MQQKEKKLVNDERKDLNILNYLKKENAYTEYWFKKNQVNSRKKNNVEISRVENEKVLENNKGLIFHEAIYSPNSGVIDVPEYVTALEGDIQNYGGLISLRTSFLSAKKKEGKFLVSCSFEDDFSIESKYL